MWQLRLIKCHLLLLTILLRRYSPIFEKHFRKFHQVFLAKKEKILRERLIFEKLPQKNKRRMEGKTKFENERISASKSRSEGLMLLLMPHVLLRFKPYKVNWIRLGTLYCFSKKGYQLGDHKPLENCPGSKTAELWCHQPHTLPD